MRLRVYFVVMIDSYSVVLFIITYTDLFLISCSFKCLTVCNVLTGRHLFLNLYPCVIKFSQSISQSFCPSLSVSLSVSPHPPPSHQPTLCVMNSVLHPQTPPTHPLCVLWIQTVLCPQPTPTPTHTLDVLWIQISIMSANNRHPQPPTHPVCYEFKQHYVCQYRRVHQVCCVCLCFKFFFIYNHVVTLLHRDTNREQNS